MTEIRVMVVDDHPMWRDGVARDLAERGFDGAGHRGRRGRGRAHRADRAAGRRADGPQPRRRSPASTATREITGELPDTRVLVLSASGEHADVLEAVKAGASGYLVKSASATELVDAVQRTAAGDAVFTPGLAGLVLGEYRRMAAGTGRPGRAAA